jgi:hypothetical protein
LVTEGGMGDGARIEEELAAQKAPPARPKYPRCTRTHFLHGSPCKLTYSKVRYRPFRNPIDNEVAAQ